MDNCVVSVDSSTVEADFGPLTSPDRTSKTTDDWIPIGRGSDRTRLERVISQLEAAWAGRWKYRIDEQADTQNERYQLLVCHL